MNDSVKCVHCSSKCGESYGTGNYLLDAESYCSINCYKELRLKEEAAQKLVTRKSKKPRKK